MSTADTPDAPEVPRVDELFNRALVAQLAEQRAQRETFAEVERKLEALERLVTDRLGELTRQLGTDGQIEGRIELLEETLGTRLGAIEKVVRAELDTRLGALADRLGQFEQSLIGIDRPAPADQPRGGGAVRRRPRPARPAGTGAGRGAQRR
jgi:hypothetical protein